MDKIYLYPTDTVWGIGGSINNVDVYKEVMAIKKCQDRPVSICFSKKLQINEYINIADQYLIDLLNKGFFELESTLMIPSSWIKNDSIPNWIYQDGQYIAIRCLNLSWVDILVDRLGPIITTSLNISGQDPITSYEDAIEFKKQYCPEAIIPSLPKSYYTENMSGVSSTILKYNSKDEFVWIRKGQKFEELSKIF